MAITIETRQGPESFQLAFAGATTGSGSLNPF
jgi:hypothetical protein